MRLRAWVAVVACLSLLVSCGSESPGDQVPELADQLSAIDDALADENYPEARQNIEDLVAATEDARASGDLGDGEADRVLAAAARLLTELPGAAPTEPAEPTTSSTPTPTPTASVTPTPEPSPTEDTEDEGDDKDDEEKEDKDSGKPEDPGKSDEGKDDKGKDKED